MSPNSTLSFSVLSKFLVKSIVLSSAILMTPTLLVADEPRDPTGEMTSYALDKSSNRTSSIILSGTSSIKVNELDEDHPDGPSYIVALNYDMKVRIYGQVKNTAFLPFVKEYFGQEFWEKLRETGTFESSVYKVKYEGKKDVALSGNRRYKDTDQVFIYDISAEFADSFKEMIVAALYAQGEILQAKQWASTTLEELTVRAKVHPSVKALGAVQLDIAGKKSGVSFKAGFDLK